MENREISYGELLRRLEHESIEEMSPSDVTRSVREDPLGISDTLPEAEFQVDPRTGLRVVYTPARGERPHDYAKPEGLDEERAEKCPICAGHTTGIMDLARLSDGWTFINKNLYPIVYYHEDVLPEHKEREAQLTPGKVLGGHYVQWTHNRHGADLHNMPAKDVETVMRRLAVFEGRMLHEPPQDWPVTWKDENGEHRGYVGIIKNFGYLVGGSLAHGHQQMIHSTILPRRIEEDIEFQGSEGKGFARFMLDENPPDLTVKDYGPVRTVVPYFMKRPLDAMIIVKDTEKSFLHDLAGEELRALGDAVRELTAGLEKLMPEYGRVFTYNMNLHNGAKGGMYMEFLPYTQETGGYEHLGVYICQRKPESSAGDYKRVIA